MKEEGRPIMSRWTAMDTNRAIREKVPGWTANLSLRHAAMAAKRGEGKTHSGEGYGEGYAEGGGEKSNGL
jgi:hypothetical protein